MHWLAGWCWDSNHRVISIMPINQGLFFIPNLWPEGPSSFGTSFCVPKKNQISLLVLSIRVYNHWANFNFGTTPHHWKKSMGPRYSFHGAGLFTKTGQAVQGTTRSSHWDSGFPKIGVPQNGRFIMEIHLKMDDLGVPLFSETSTPV